MTDNWWGLYNYENLVSSFRTRTEAVKYFETSYSPNDSWRTAKRKGYMSIRPVVITSKEDLK